MNLILASGSPRRRELLTEAGYRFRVIEPDPQVECGVCSGSGPEKLVVELALRKAHDVVRQLDLSQDSIVLSADTVAECDGQILGKPSDSEHARAMLVRLAGREHRVFSGVCVWRIGRSSATPPDLRVAATTLRMDPLDDLAIDHYVASDMWQGKAGGFGYQDRLGWVHIVSGSPSNVVGLPMEIVSSMLAEAGVKASVLPPLGG